MSRAPGVLARIDPPARLLAARARAAGLLVAACALVVASFWSLDLQWRALFSRDSAHAMARFVAEFFPPDASPPFVRKVARATLETAAMSALGTLLAMLFGLLLALPAARTHARAENLSRTSPALPPFSRLPHARHLAKLGHPLQALLQCRRSPPGRRAAGTAIPAMDRSAATAMARDATGASQQGNR